ncbi:hypothetical protein JOM56_012548 [Amanita muscaria]
MVSYQLVSSKGRKEGRSCYIVPTSFEVTVEGANCKITTITPITTQVAFKQKHVGRCEDRLENRDADHEALKAKAPYVPQLRTSRLHESRRMMWLKAAATKAVPYVDRLPHAHILSPLLSTLSSGTTIQYQTFSILKTMSGHPYMD